MIRWRNLPRRIIIKSNPWRIFFHRGRVIDEKTREEIWGFCSPLRKEIHIAPGQPPLDRLDTLIHEILHAIEAEYGFCLGHEIINLLAPALAALLVENIAQFQSPRKGRESRREGTKEDIS